MDVGVTHDGLYDLDVSVLLADRICREYVLFFCYNTYYIIKGFSPEKQEEILERGVERSKQEKTA